MKPWFELNSLSFSGLFHIFEFSLQKYRYQDEDTPPQEHISPQITNEVIGPELVHVSEKNLSEIENVHGFVSHSHISPIKVGWKLYFVAMNYIFCYSYSSCSERTLCSCRIFIPCLWFLSYRELHNIYKDTFYKWVLFSDTIIKPKNSCKGNNYFKYYTLKCLKCVLNISRYRKRALILTLTPFRNNHSPGFF